MALLKKIRYKCMDLFFARPYVFDVIISLLFGVILYILNMQGTFSLESIDSDKINKVASKIGTSCITIAGFVLTILTIVISFKTSEDSRINDNNNKEHASNSNNSPNKVSLFFRSDLYFKTVRIFQQSVTGLVIIFVLLIMLDVFNSFLSKEVIFLCTLCGLTIATLIFLRCLLTLKLIISLQKSNIIEKE